METFPGCQPCSRCFWWWHFLWKRDKNRPWKPKFSCVLVVLSLSICLSHLTVLTSCVKDQLVNTVAMVVSCFPLTLYGNSLCVSLCSFEVVRVIHEKLLDMVGNVQYVHTHTHKLVKHISLHRFSDKLKITTKTHRGRTSTAFRSTKRLLLLPGFQLF